MSLVQPDLLSILARDENAGVAAVAAKAVTYQKDAEEFGRMVEEARGDVEPYLSLKFAYGIVARELKNVAQDLKSGPRP